ncbi:MAG: hypothetical protein M9928_15190 [Anaerolineae bacterium]|nr:hypothetical protein [Anaerolineae bacterium]
MNGLIALLIVILLFALRFGLPLVIVLLGGWLACRISDRRFARINGV